MNGRVEPVGDPDVEKGLRSQSLRIYVESAIAALILTGLSFFFASVLPEAARAFPDLSLEQAAHFLIRHGYAVLFGWVLLEQHPPEQDGVAVPNQEVGRLFQAQIREGTGRLGQYARKKETKTS